MSQTVKVKSRNIVCIGRPSFEVAEILREYIGPYQETFPLLTYHYCVVADRGMISANTLKELEDPERNIAYMLGTRMRKVNEIKREVLSRPGRYREVRVEKKFSKEREPLKVKEVLLEGKWYIVCLNPRQARKDAQDREAINTSLKDRIKTGPKSLIGNRGYRKYLKIERESVSIDQDKIAYESRFMASGC